MKLSRKEIIGNRQVLEKILLAVENIITSSKTKESLKKKLQKKSKKRNVKQSNAKIGSGIFKDFLDWDTSEIARQLTMSEWDLFVKISPKEFVGMSWQKNDKETLAPNLTKLTARFNQVILFSFFFCIN